MTIEKTVNAALTTPQLDMAAEGNRIPAAVIGMSAFLVSLDITAVVVAMPRIKSDLGLDVSGFAWVMDAYSLTFTVMLMAAGVLADRYGRRRTLMAGNLVFCAASLACGLSASSAALWTARAVQGLGAAFVICGGLALLSARYPNGGSRAKAFALTGTISGAAMALGPSVGGIITELAGWRWVFFINLPVCAFIAVGLPRVASESFDPAHRKIDILGLVLFSSTLLVVVWLLLHGPRLGSVTFPAWVGALLAIGLCALLIATQRVQKTPLVDVELFRSRRFVGMCSVPLSLSVAYWSALVYLPLFMRDQLGQPLDQVAWWMLAATAPMVLLPGFGARIFASVQPRTFFAAGLGVVGLGGLLIAYAARDSSLPLAMAGMLLCGCGTALVNAQISGVIVAMAPRERAGAVAGIATIMRQGGFAIGIAGLGALLRTESPAGPGAAYAMVFFATAAVSFAGALFVLVTVRPVPADSTS